MVLDKYKSAFVFMTYFQFSCWLLTGYKNPLNGTYCKNLKTEPNKEKTFSWFNFNFRFVCWGNVHIIESHTD